MTQPNCPIIRGDIFSDIKPFQHPLLTSKVAPITQSDQATIPPTHRKV